MASKVRVSSPGKTSPGKADYRWWKPELDSDPEKRAGLISGLVKKLRLDQRSRIEADLLHMSLYSGRKMLGYGASRYWRAVDYEDDTFQALSANIIRSGVNSVVSKVGKNRPKPTPITDEGNWELQDRAENLDRFIQGQFYEAGLYEVDLRWLLYATVLGTAFLKVVRTDDPTDKDDEPGIAVDLLLPGQVIVDEVEAIAGKPRTIHTRYYIDKAELKELYPGKADDIEKAKLPEDDDFGFDSMTNQVMVIESWRLPTGKEPGRHCIVLDNIMLLDEPYKRETFPLVKLIYDDEMLGFWGSGIPYLGFGYQSEINRLLLKIQKAMHLLAVPHIFLDRGAAVDVNEWTNELATFIEGNFGSGGMVPQVITPSLFGPEVYGHLERLRNWFFDDLGISQIMANGDKPPGITAAAALESLTDSDSERFVKLARRWEQAHVEVAEHMIELAEQINEGDDEPGYVKKKYAVVWYGTDNVANMNWADVNMKRDEYSLKVVAASALPTGFSGRLQAVQNVLQLVGPNVFSPGELLELMGLPDLKAATSLKTAPQRYLKRSIQMILKGENISPEPDDNLDMAAQFMTMELQKAKTMGRPEDVQQHIRDYLLQLKELKAKAAGQAEPPTGQPASMLPPGPPGPPQGQPMPPAMGAPPGVPIQ